MLRNKSEEANFIQTIYDLSYLTKKYYKEENLDKLYQTLFIIQDYVEKVTGDQFYIEDAIYELDKKLQRKGKFLSKGRLNYIRDFFNEKRKKYDRNKH